MNDQSSTSTVGVAVGGSGVSVAIGNASMGAANVGLGSGKAFSATVPAGEVLPGTDAGAGVAGDTELGGAGLFESAGSGVGLLTATGPLSAGISDVTPVGVSVGRILMMWMRPVESLPLLPQANVTRINRAVIIEIGNLAIFKAFKFTSCVSYR